MFENPRRGRQASKTFDNKSSENSRSQMVFRTDILKLTLDSLTYNSGELTSTRLQTHLRDVCEMTVGKTTRWQTDRLPPIQSFTGEWQRKKRRRKVMHSGGNLVIS